MNRKEDLVKRKADAERMIADGAVLDEYQAYLPEAQEDEALTFHYFMRDSILEFKKLRKQKGITQAVLAARMGTKQTAVSRFESYNGEPSLKFLYKYAMALGLEIHFTTKTGLDNGVAIENKVRSVSAKKTSGMHHPQAARALHK